MNRRRYYLCWLVIVAVTHLACDRDGSSGLKGQVNTTLTFYGLTVDQDGQPIPGVKVEYQVDAYPKDWTFETRGRPYDTSIVSATSDASGRFQLKRPLNEPPALDIALNIVIMR